MINHEEIKKIGEAFASGLSEGATETNRKLIAKIQKELGINDMAFPEKITQKALRETHEGDNGKWIPWPDKRPDHPGLYIVSGGVKVWVCEYLELGNLPGGWLNDCNNPCVRAWMPLPEPYSEGGEQDE